MSGTQQNLAWQLLPNSVEQPKWEVHYGDYSGLIQRADPSGFTLDCSLNWRVSERGHTIAVGYCTDIAPAKKSIERIIRTSAPI